MNLFSIAEGMFVFVVMVLFLVSYTIAIPFVFILQKYSHIAFWQRAMGV